MLPLSIRTFMSFTQQPSTFRSVLVARLTASLMAASKLSWFAALISTTRATLMAFVPLSLASFASSVSLSLRRSDKDLHVAVLVVHQLVEAALDHVGQGDALGDDPLGFDAAVLEHGDGVGEVFGRVADGADHVELAQDDV